jgi:hypothetical protein
MSDITERELTIHNQINHWLISQIVSDRDIRLIRKVERSWE